MTRTCQSRMNCGQACPAGQFGAPVARSSVRPAFVATYDAVSVPPRYVGGPMLAEEVGADLVQATPSEAGTGQPYRDRLAHRDVDAVATVGPAEADDVRPGATPRHGGSGPTRRLGQPEQPAQQAGHEDERDEKGSAGSHREAVQVATSAWRRNSALTTLPVALRGSPSMKRYRRGTL